MTAQASQSSLRAFIYARKSGDDGDTQGNKSIAAQLEACRALCRERGYIVQGVYSESNVSGRTYWQGAAIAEVDLAFQGYYKAHIKAESKKYREEMGKVMAGLSQVDVIVVYDKTRLARPANGSMLEIYLFQCLREHGVTIEQVEGGLIKPESSTDQLIQYLTSNVADQQLVNSLGKAMAVKANLKESGYLVTGSIGYGYRNTGRQRVEIDESKAEVVRLIFSLFLQGHTQTQIARELTRRGIPTIKAKSWTQIHVRRILERPGYAGLALNKEGTLIASQVLPALIDESDWHKAQARLSLNQGLKKREKAIVHPLTGLLRCGQCGSRMVLAYSTHTQGKPNYSYKCANAQYTKAGSPCRRVSTIEGRRIDGPGLVESLMPLCIHGLIKQLKAKLSKSEDVASLEKVDRDLATIETKRSEIKAMYIDGALTMLDMSDMGKALTLKEKKLASEKATLEKRLFAVEHATFDQSIIMAACMNGLKPEVYRELVYATVKRIDCFNDHVTVIVNGSSFDLPKLPVRNGHVFSNVSVRTPDRLTAESMVELRYLVPGMDGEAIAYQSDTLRVVLTP